MENSAKVNSSKYELNGKPPLKEAIPLGLQHILAMFVGNVTVPIIIAGILGFSNAEQTILIQSAMFVAGIATLVQLYPIGRVGAKMPVVMGTSFGFLPTCIAIGNSFGLAGILGAQLIGGFFCGFLGLFLKPLRKFFPSLVTGTVVLTIGLSLLPTGITYMAGGSGAADFGSPSNWSIALIVLVTVVFFKQFTKGFTSLASILIGLIVGYLVAIPLGKVDFSAITQAGWFAIPRPLHFGLAFHWEAIVAMLIMYVVTTVETVGDISGIAMGGANREATDRELSGGIISNGLGSSFAALFNALPNTSYSQNVGLVSFTGIMSRFVVATGAIFLLIAGLFPKLGAIVVTVPQSVLGGATVVMFSQIALTGINLITKEKLTTRNKIIVGLALALGLGLGQVPDALAYLPDSIQLIFGGSGIVIACIVALLLNIILPQDKIQKKVEKEIA
ncbi:uracil-xanthine permease family protein [Sporosalibacterium faouarense]|uniref:uracil-xanthine permease family protein n=1 Tax=Sporosalibacterium faouarense TaxID=516123 RepID=UPI00141D3EBA|nr:nucleobase:cation symporter-2 family protein [Sporosalibacterium faouarense]MTI48264.1 purine permease [Bacillota bacterium]